MTLKALILRWLPVCTLVLLVLVTILTTLPKNSYKLKWERTCKAKSLIKTSIRSVRKLNWYMKHSVMTLRTIPFTRLQEPFKFTIVSGWIISAVLITFVESSLIIFSFTLTPKGLALTLEHVTQNMGNVLNHIEHSLLL